MVVGDGGAVRCVCGSGCAFGVVVVVGVGGIGGVVGLVGMWWWFSRLPGFKVPSF